jgi:hypothetical protein
MKRFITNISIKSLGLSFVLTIGLIFSLSSCGNNQGRKGNSSKTNNESLCSIHNQDCNKMASDMNMDLEEYHQWSEDIGASIEAEDANTNSDGDIVDPNSTSCSKCNGTGKIITGCPGYGHSWIAKCSNGYYKCDNCKLGNTGWYYDKNGDVCSKCKGNGKYQCAVCVGLGDRYYKYCDQCKGN